MDQVAVAPLSMSAEIRMPVAEEVTSSSASPEAVPAMTGSSLLPVMVMVTSCVSVAPSSSVTVTVNTAVTCSPSPRKSSLSQ